MHPVKAFVAILALLTLPLTAHLTTPAIAAGGFTNFQLGDGPNLGVPGEVCPNSNPHPASSTPPCTNTQGEPQIRANNAGEFYGGSENGVTSGTEAYRSLDNGATYKHLLSPNQTSTIAAGTPGSVGPGGGDVDIATAPVQNAQGIYNTYVSSLSLANVTVSTSMDRGESWQINPVAARVPGDDRNWVAADMASKVCTSYRDLPALAIEVDCSYDAGKTFLQHGDAVDAAHPEVRTNFEIGNLTIDPNSHVIYQTFSSIDKNDFTRVPNVACTNLVGQPCQNHVVYMGVSTDGGKTFTDYVVHDGPPNVSYGHQFVNVSVDRAGNVYSVYSDDHNVYYSYSTDQGKTWTGPFQINKGTGGQQTAIMPWSTAGTDGRVAVVFYGADYYKTGVSPDNYPCNERDHCNPAPDAADLADPTRTAHWNVFYTENLSATTNGAGFTTPVQVTDPPVHYGGVCEGGVGCTGNRSRNRDLYDDFSVAVSPVTNTASIIHDSDRYFEYGHAARVNNGTSQSAPCPQSSDNTGSCTHTDIAVGQSHIFANAPGGGGDGTGGDGGGDNGGSGDNGGECHATAQSHQTEVDLLNSMNAHRVAAGLPALTLNQTQSEQARAHACDNQESNSNNDSDSEGTTHDQRMRAAGETFTISGENNTSAVPAAGTSTGSLLDNSLMSNSTTSLNVLSPTFTKVGIGAVDVNGTTWVTEDFSD